MLIFALLLADPDMPVPTPALCKSSIMTTYFEISAGNLDKATGRPKKASKERKQLEQDLRDLLPKLDARFGALDTGGTDGIPDSLIKLSGEQLLVFDQSCLALPQ